jgi:hypothetical protein
MFQLRYKGLRFVPPSKPFPSPFHGIYQTRYYESRGDGSPLDKVKRLVNRDTLDRCTD